MFINENYVALTFKLINFAILIGLVAFVFKKYAKKEILFLMNEEEAQHNALLVEQRNLELQQSNLDHIVKEEHSICEQFKITVEKWKKVVLDEKATHEKKQYALLDTIKKRHTQLALHKNNTRIQNAAIDQTITMLNTALSDNFKTPLAGTEYLNGIIRFMNERASS